MKTLILTCCFIACSTAFGQVSSNDIGGKQINGEIMINAKPSAVYAQITNCMKHCAMFGDKHISGATSFTKIGNASYLDCESGDKGSLVVTMAQPEKELRLLFEPDNGTYVCGEKWTLTPSGTGTKLNYIQTFTLSGPMDANAVNHCVQIANKGLNDLKMWCEKK